MCVDKRWSRLNRGFSQVNVQLFPEILSRNVQQETIVSKISYISATHKKNKTKYFTKSINCTLCKLKFTATIEEEEGLALNTKISSKNNPISFPNRLLAEIYARE